MITRTAFTLLLALAGATLVSAADFTGRWEGTSAGPDGDFTIGITRTGDQTSGVLDVGPFGTFPMEDLEIEGDTISFKVSGGAWSHEGTFKDGVIAVTVHGPQGDFPLTMKRKPADVAGKWNATADGPDGPMHLVFTFTLTDGKIGGTVSSALL